MSLLYGKESFFVILNEKDDFLSFREAILDFENIFRLDYKILFSIKLKKQFFQRKIHKNMIQFISKLVIYLSFRMKRCFLEFREAILEC